VHMNRYRLGSWIWGFVLIVWLVFAGLAVAGERVPWYGNLKELNNLSAAITAVLGVIWSWFLQLARTDAKEPK
jgi:hypothetical protein